MFQVNDTILYGVHGVCRITDITTKNLCGNTMEYYVLQQVYDMKSVLFVPTQNPALTDKMKKILSPAEIYDMIQAMPDEKTIWIPNEPQRKERYAAILKSGDRTELIRMIKTLHLHKNEQLQKGKKMHMADERFLHDAESLLHEEFAHVLKIKREQVLPFILEQVDIKEKEL